jgi:hypothetical protein
MTEKQVKDLGFKFVKTFTCGDNNEYQVNRYIKGCLELDFNYLNGVLEDVDVTLVEDVTCLPVTFNELKKLDSILNG